MARFCPECGGKKIVDLKDTIFCEKCGILLRNDFHASTHSFINNFFKNDPNSKGNVIKGGKKNEIDIQKGTSHIFTIKKNEQDLEKIKDNLKQVHGKSYTQISQDAVDMGFKSFGKSARSFYEKRVNKFTQTYIRNYKNSFSTNFKSIISIHFIKSKDEFLKRV